MIIDGYFRDTSDIPYMTMATEAFLFAYSSLTVKFIFEEPSLPHQTLYSYWYLFDFFYLSECWINYEQNIVETMMFLFPKAVKYANILKLSMKIGKKDIVAVHSQVFQTNVFVIKIWHSSRFGFRFLLKQTFQYSTWKWNPFVSS